MAMNRTRNILRSQGGFTIAELLIAVALLVMVLGAAYTLFDFVIGKTDYISGGSQATEDARLAMNSITRLLRQSQERVDGEGAIYRAQPRWIGFYCDYDKDGALEKVEFRVQGKDLYRSFQEPDAGSDPATYDTTTPQEKVLIASADTGWNGNVFDYFGVGDPPPTVPAGQPEDVAAVEVELRTLGKQQGMGVQHEGIRLTSWVRIRSVHNGLD